MYDDSQTIDIDNVPLHGGFLLKTLVLSIDPYFRGLMQAGGAYDIVRGLSCIGVSFTVNDNLGCISSRTAVRLIISALCCSCALIGLDFLSIVSHGVGLVLRSECPQVKVGDHLYGYLSMNSF